MRDWPPGDCAFVGIYGDYDDFALVLMEDVDGESISLVEGSPADADFHVDHWAAAKHYVSDSKKGSVLRRSDFQTDDASFLAPMALSAFKSPAESPTVLCSIILESRPVARKLQSVVMLSSMETAEYSGPTSGRQDGVVGGNLQANQLAPVTASLDGVQHRFGQRHHRDRHHHDDGEHGEHRDRKQHRGKQRGKWRCWRRQHGPWSLYGVGCHGIGTGTLLTTPGDW